MLFLPSDIVALLSQFAPVFTPRIWRHFLLLIVGAILALGRRRVSSALRAIGLRQTPPSRRTTASSIAPAGPA